MSGTPDRFERFGENLWRWTTPHPLWAPREADHTGGWPQDVGSVVYVGDGTATIVDPQAGEDDAELWAVLDARTAGAERPVVALTASDPYAESLDGPLRVAARARPPARHARAREPRPAPAGRAERRPRRPRPSAMAPVRLRMSRT